MMIHEELSHSIRGSALIPDFIVVGLVIVETKVVVAFHDTHVAQMIGDLAITELRLGLLLNFRFARLTSKRIVR